MRVSGERKSIRFRLCILLVSTFLAMSYGYAGAEPTANDDCGSPTTSSPAYGVAWIRPPNCDKLVRQIQASTERFFRDQCQLLEAKIYGLRSSTYNIANELIDLTRRDFAEISAEFLQIADEIDESYDIVQAQSEEHTRAREKLRLAGYAIPRTYKQAFLVLAAAIDDASKSLADVEIVDDGLPSPARHTVYDAMARPGAVFLAITTLLNPSGSGS